jgi:hypothetical protein
VAALGNTTPFADRTSAAGGPRCGEAVVAGKFHRLPPDPDSDQPAQAPKDWSVGWKLGADGIHFEHPTGRIDADTPRRAPGFLPFETFFAKGTDLEAE